jgi:hypothetical protein
MLVTALMSEISGFLRAMEYSSPFLHTRDFAAIAAGFGRLIHEKMIEISFAEKKDGVISSSQKQKKPPEGIEPSTC